MKPASLVSVGVFTFYKKPNLEVLLRKTEWNTDFIVISQERQLLFLL